MFVPFHTFILKVASRCNLNCSYCFVYNQADSRWQNQPALMAEETIRQTAFQIKKHCQNHEKKDISIILHGGEPLLGGIDYLNRLVEIFKTVFVNTDINASFSIQSNGILFTPEVGEFLLKNNISIGISLDGPPEINDQYRVDHKGRPTTAILEKKLEILTSDYYQSIFSGFLFVINIASDPISVLEYLASFKPPGIDFILPYDNHDRLPVGKENDPNLTPYADWLIKLFNYWFYNNLDVRMRGFESIIRQIVGGSSLVESIGLNPVDLIVIETNGDIEAVDSLKATFEGATVLGYNVFEHDFNIVAQDIAVQNRQKGADSLCQKCQDCSVVDFCGGGYLPNRYSSERGFDNPSVYCQDLEKLIKHIYNAVTIELKKQEIVK